MDLGFDEKRLPFVEAYPRPPILHDNPRAGYRKHASSDHLHRCCEYSLFHRLPGPACARAEARIGACVLSSGIGCGKGVGAAGCIDASLQVRHSELQCVAAAHLLACLLQSPRQTATNSGGGGYDCPTIPLPLPVDMVYF